MMNPKLLRFILIYQYCWRYFYPKLKKSNSSKIHFQSPCRFFFFSLCVKYVQVNATQKESLCKMKEHNEAS